MPARLRLSIALSCLFVGGLLAALPAGAMAQTGGIAEWRLKRLAALLAVPAEANADKQVEAPAVADSSATLVDRSTAPDLFGLATQFFNLAKADGSEPISVTVSAFAVRTALQGRDPSRPEVYTEGRPWRRFSFTVGREPASADGAKPESQILGAKVLLWDGRDLSRQANIDLLQRGLTENGAVTTLAGTYAEFNGLLFDLLGAKLGVDRVTFLTVSLDTEHTTETLGKLSPEDLAKVDDFLLNRLVPALNQLPKNQAAVLKALTQAPQFAVSYQSKLRRGDGDDEHALEAIFDYGLAKRLNISANAALSRVQRTVLPSETDWKFAAEGSVKLTAAPSGLSDLLRQRTPITLSGSFTATRHTGQLNTRKGQVKLTLPIAFGVSLPISVTVANRTELIDEKDIRGQVGFTIDFAKIQQAFKARVK